MPSDSPPSVEKSVSAADADAAGDSTAHPGSPAIVEWGPVRFDRLRSVALGASVTAGGLVVAVLAVAALGIGASLLGGSGPPSSTWAALVVLFVGGPVSLLYWLVAYDRTSPERRRELLSQFGDYSFDPSRFRPRWTLVGAGAVLALVFATTGTGPLPATPSLFPGLVPLFFALLAFTPALAASRGTDVRLDPGALSVERTYRSHDRTRADDLGAVVRTRRIDLPWTTVFLLAYRGNAWYRSTPWLFAPSDRADAVEAALADALARSDGPSRASVPERAILALVGSFSLVAGGVMTVAAGGGTAGVVLALLTAPFSLLFLALAARL
ncbi:MAG: hypothetical protein R6U01_09375 [Halorubrum sp.]|uniref:hypothetical protein n=1 Tax=Halorubrum sp. TaxID=1879286 RepID=UPI0039711539